MMTQHRRLASWLVAVAVVWLPDLRPAAADENPCALLPLGDVRSVYPDAQAGVVDAKLAKDGIFRCTWKHGTDTLFLVTGSAADDTVADEAETWALTILDPLRSDAARHLRYEKMRGIGDEAVAVVERADKAKGLAQDGAYIAVKRGQMLATILAPDLARGDRAEALRKLALLARNVGASR